MNLSRFLLAGIAAWLAAACHEIQPTVAPAEHQTSDFGSVSFEAADGLLVSADLHAGVSRKAPVVLLFHQSMSSRGEFRNIAPRLAQLGYNALAVDLRWGGRRGDVVNRTAERNNTSAIVSEVEAGKASPWPTIDASYQDMVAATHWLRTEGFDGPVYALGSSFSAMLVYRLAAEGLADAVLAFSPGEYDESRPELVRGWARAFDGPVLAVAAPGEEFMVADVHAATKGRASRLFVAPAGRHGASILDSDNRNWQMLVAFLGHHAGGPPLRTEVKLAVDHGGLFLDRYEHSETEAPVLVLFHQGGGSARGEYGFLIADLLEAGFHVIAADLHGGGDRFAFANRTLAHWPEPDGFSYCDALSQVSAVLEYVRNWKPQSPLIAWGSSYSGALVLHAAVNNPGLIERVAAFSPASGQPMAGCSADADLAGRLNLPVLLARPERELELPSVAAQVTDFRNAGHEFMVVAEGVHGSSMLNPVRVANPQQLRRTVIEFLSAASSQ